ncbi:MAG TPA: transcription termination/antitermination NusG family protein, partial [Candidatus Tumulicola sp.]|nr:transcription termination/antitermination NusG family protein [Candidatus Tumulicola sp.]
MFDIGQDPTLGETGIIEESGTIDDAQMGDLSGTAQEPALDAQAAGEPEGEPDAEPGEPEAPKPKDNRNWFVVHTYSGYENKVKANLERRIHSMGMQDKIFRVLVPMEDEVEFKDGKRKITPKKVFPGYVLVEMIM